LKGKKNICVFIHYCGIPVVPVYVQIYANELAKRFDEVVIYTNKRELEQAPLILDKQIQIYFEKNEGYDFGLFYKFFKAVNPGEYSQIACVNDSNVLIGKLDDVFSWAKNSDLDMWGLVDSNEKPPFSTHENNYHVQSHFLVFEEKGIRNLTGFFDTLDITDLFGEKDSKLLRKRIIDCWEIGLSQYFIKRGLKIGSYIDSGMFIKRYGRGKERNVTYDLYKELISKGYPCIKKKIILHIDWRDFFRTKKLWKRVVNKYGRKEYRLNDSISEIKMIKKESGSNSLISVLGTNIRKALRA